MGGPFSAADHASAASCAHGTADEVRRGMRWVISMLGLAPLISACTTADTPTITLARGSDDLQIDYVRPYGHQFSPINLTVNGQAVGGGSISEGAPQGPHDQSAVPARAVFTVPLASIDRGVELELTEGDEQFFMDAPDFAAPRALQLHTPVNALHAADWIELDSGVADDGLVANFDVKLGDTYCFSSQGNRPSPGGVAVGMPPAGQNNCGPTNPPAGSTLDVQLHLAVAVTTVTTRCDGPGLVCDPVGVSMLTESLPAVLAY